MLVFPTIELPIEHNEEWSNWKHKKQEESVVHVYMNLEERRSSRLK